MIDYKIIIIFTIPNTIYNTYLCLTKEYTLRFQLAETQTKENDKISLTLKIKFIIYLINTMLSMTW
jgi:hypothetical protein